MEAIVKRKYLKGSPRKARLVIDLIRGANVSRALSILKFTDKRAAEPIAQCLNSAIANATYKAEQDNIAIDPDDLWVNKCFVDMGPTKGRKRMRPAPQGRAFREQRHYCHITIQVTSEEKPKTEKELKAEAAKAKRGISPKKEKKTVASPEVKAQVKKVQDHLAEAEDQPIADTSVPTPVEPTAQAIMATADEAAEPIEETPAETAEAIEAAGDAEVADAKDVETQSTEALNETQPADEAQQKINEDLERQ